jgi:DHA2 family multidrug resistance protein-like MFS transporter
MQTTDQPKAGTKEWIALAVLALPTLLVSMDTTVVYLAVPSISQALKPSSSQQLWITDIYGFLECGFLITMGTLGDRIGRRKLLLIGAVAFAIASGMAAFAKSAELLIAARALLGIAGATLLPSTLSMLRNMFHNDAQRGFAVGLWTTCFSTGTMLGPVVGGFLLSHFWWGSVFLMSVPVMVLFLIIGPLLLPEFKDPVTGKFDFFSVLLLVVTVLPITYGIKELAEGDGIIMLLPVLVGLFFGIIFLRRQGKLDDPLINLSLFKIPLFRIALVTTSIALFMWCGIFLFVGQYLQLVLNMTPLAAGLWTLPAAIISTFSCSFADPLSKIIRKPVLITIALFTMALGLSVFTQISTNLTLLLIASMLISTGCGMAVTLSMGNVMTAAPPERAGAAAGISETITTLGGSFGIALLGSIGVAVYRFNFIFFKTHDVPQTAVRAAANTFGAAIQVAEKLSPGGRKALIDHAQSAFLQSFRISAGVAAALMIIIAVVVGLMFRAAEKKIVKA